MFNPLFKNGIPQLNLDAQQENPMPAPPDFEEETIPPVTVDTDVETITLVEEPESHEDETSDIQTKQELHIRNELESHIEEKEDEVDKTTADTSLESSNPEPTVATAVNIDPYEPETKPAAESEPQIEPEEVLVVVHEPAPVREVTIDETVIVKEPVDVRRPDTNIGDVILEYKDDGTVVKSRGLYNRALVRAHVNYRKNGSYQESIMAEAFVKDKHDGNCVTTMWDEGGNHRRRGFAVTATDTDGRKLTPLTIFLPNVEKHFKEQDTVYVNWHHARLPIVEGNYIVSCSNDIDNEAIIMVHRVENIEIQKEDKPFKSHLSLRLVSLLSGKDEELSEIYHQDEHPFHNGHPVFGALLSQCNNDRAELPAYCRCLMPVNIYPKSYLSNKKFDEILQVFKSNDELNEKLQSLLDDEFQKLADSGNSRKKQVRLYRVAKYYAKTNDIVLFYYAVLHDVKKGTYDRLFYGYVIVTPDMEVTLFDDDRVYSFEQLKTYIREYSRSDQAIREFRKVW